MEGVWKPDKDANGKAFDLIEKLHENLERLKAHNGINGYILRGLKSASVDLKDPNKIIEYAALSSTTLESAEEISRAMSLGNINRVVLEGKNAKILALTISDYRLSIFMDKNIDPNEICAELGL
jgi:predicted regulator of Ras-like GTPase activity (Roadblock/LC7/MglB family)